MCRCGLLRCVDLAGHHILLLALAGGDPCSGAFRYSTFKLLGRPETFADDGRSSEQHIDLCHARSAALNEDPALIIQLSKMASRPEIGDVS